MLTRLRVGTPTGLSILFVLLAGIPLAALGWLGSRLLAQEQELEYQQRLKLLENSASLLTHEIDRSLSRWEEAAAAGITGATATLPPGTVLLAYDSRGVLRGQGVRLPYVPALAPDLLPRSPALAAAAAAEYQVADPEIATNAYRRIADTIQDRPTRAAALLGLGRGLRKQSKIRDAIAVYEELASMHDVPAAGFPAELVARGNCACSFRQLVTSWRVVGSRAPDTSARGGPLSDRPRHVRRARRVVVTSRRKRSAGAR